MIYLGYCKKEVIKITSFNLDHIREKVIRFLIKDEPHIRVRELAEITGMSERNMYRCLRKYGIKTFQGTAFNT